MLFFVKAVGLARIDDQFGFDAVALEAAVEFLALAGGISRISVALENQRGSLGVLQVNKRGAVQKAGDFIWFVREAVEPLVIRGALFGTVFGDEVGEAGAGDGGFEAGGLRDRPFGHVAAVGPTADGQFFGIRDAFCDEVVDAGHHVPVIAATPVAAIRFDEFLAVTTGAADIGIENRVAPRSKKLSPGFDGVLPSTGGAAVDEGD